MDIETEGLAEELSELFRENVSVADVTQRELGGASVSVATMSYTTHSDSSSGGMHTRHHEHTAIVLDEAQLDLPEFSLRPKVKGVLGMMMKALGDFAALDFPDSPEFQAQYHLHAWAADPVRILFTKDIRDYLAQHLGWSVCGKQHRLVIYQADNVVKPSALDDFLREALTIAELFQAGEEQLDERPDVRRGVRPEDVSRTASQMGGIVGAMLQKQLQKIAITRSELDEFIASAPPRVIPPGMKRQVLGETLPLVFVGTLFFFGGIVGGTVWILLSEGVVKLMGIPFLTLFPLAGFLMAFLTLRFRKRKSRTLREGMLTQGFVTDVRKTSVKVNDQMRFEVVITYEHDGKELTTKSNTYGTAVDLARSLKDSQRATQLLVDPADASHVISLDLLILFD